MSPHVPLLPPGSSPKVYGFNANVIVSLQEATSKMVLDMVDTYVKLAPIEGNHGTLFAGQGLMFTIGNLYQVS